MSRSSLLPLYVPMDRYRADRSPFTLRGTFVGREGRSRVGVRRPRSWEGPVGRAFAEAFAGPSKHTDTRGPDVRAVVQPPTLITPTVTIENTAQGERIFGPFSAVSRRRSPGPWRGDDPTRHRRHVRASEGGPHAPREQRGGDEVGHRGRHEVRADRRREKKGEVEHPPAGFRSVSTPSRTVSTTVTVSG